MVEHWDGSAWTRTATPDSASYLEDVEALAPDDVWAIGGGQGSVFHWDGKSWAQRYHAVPGKYSGLCSLAVLSPTQVWAVGNAGTSALALHWNGRSWHAFVGPGARGGINSYFTAVTGLAPSDVWAVANNHDGNHTPGLFDPFVYHFDGVHWTATKPPNTDGEELDTIAERTPTDIFVTATDRGAYLSSDIGSLTWRRSGGTWQRVADGRFGRRVLALDPLGTPWAVGFLGTGEFSSGIPKTRRPLIERYSC